MIFSQNIHFALSLSMGMLSAATKYATTGLFLLAYTGIIKPLQFYVRTFVYLLLIAICALYGASASILLTLVGKQGLSQWTTARLFYTLCRLLLGIKVVIKNREILTNTRPAVFLSNHQSELDILMLGATFPKYCSVTAKKSLKSYPFLGWFMTLSGSVFIDRANRENALAAFSSAAKKMNKDQQSVFIFPEGTRSYSQSPALLPLKKGAFYFAIEAQVPLVPYVVSNYSNIFSFQKRIFQSGTIEVQVLDPIKTEGLGKENVNELHSKTEKLMQETVEKLGYGSEQ